MTDYVEIVSDYIRTKPVVEQGRTPYFLPAQNPGPLIPSDASVAAFAKIRRFLRDSRHDERLFVNRTTSRIQHFQDYILKPIDSNWQKLVQFLREEYIMGPYRPDLNSQDVDWMDISTYVTEMENEGGKPISTIQQSRIRLLAQIDAITGGSSIGLNFIQLLPGNMVAGSINNDYSISWASAYYNNGVVTIELLRRVYRRKYFRYYFDNKALN